MSLIDRYIHEVGRHLPRKNRADIQAELRSLLVDTLEDRAGGEPTEAEIVAMLESFGPPKKVAASYFPEGQYLIGPALYPIFRLVVGIAVAAVLGSQLLAVGVGIFFAEAKFNPFEVTAGLVNSIPAVVGSVVIVFAILQWFEVKPDADDVAWNPLELPRISESETVSRGELIFGIVGGIFILGVLTIIPNGIGFVTSPGGEFFANPVIVEYLGWISAGLILSIALDIYLLWQGRWQRATRFLKIALNLYSIAILALLVQGHNAWLAEHGVTGFISALERLPEDISSGTQLIGMQAFRLGFGVALIVTIVETIVMIYRLIRAGLKRDFQPVTLPMQKT
jgi:hypothetical protein